MTRVAVFPGSFDPMTNAHLDVARRASGLFDRLVRRGDGQTLQLTPLLYSVLEAVDGRRTCAE